MSTAKKKIYGFSPALTPIAFERFVVEVLRLSKVLGVKIDPAGIEVTRAVEGDDPVVPLAVEDIFTGVVLPAPDLVFLLNNIDIQQLEFSESRHILHTLIQLFGYLDSRGLFVAGIYVCAGDELAAALGLPSGDYPRLFGIPVQYVTAGLEPGKILAIGSPTRFIADATLGVIADLGDV